MYRWNWKYGFAGMVNGRRVEDLQLLVNVDVPFCAKYFSTVIYGIELGKEEVLILCYSTEPHISRNRTTIYVSADWG